MHTQHQTARELVIEHGADYLLTAKGNHPTVHARIQELVAAPPGCFFPQDTTPNLADQS